MLALGATLLCWAGSAEAAPFIPADTYSADNPQQAELYLKLADQPIEHAYSRANQSYAPDKRDTWTFDPEGHIEQNGSALWLAKDLAGSSIRARFTENAMTVLSSVVIGGTVLSKWTYVSGPARSVGSPSPSHALVSQPAVKFEVTAVPRSAATVAANLSAETGRSYDSPERPRSYEVAALLAENNISPAISITSDTSLTSRGVQSTKAKQPRPQRKIRVAMRDE
jgi:hypothetical protein